MPSAPSLQDRLLKRAIPRPVESYKPPPQPLCAGVWALDRRLRHFGLALLPSRTSIVRLGEGRLVVVSPPSLVDAGARDAIDALGSVADVVVPNPFHYLSALELLGHYPEARLWLAPGVRERVPELDFAQELGGEPPDGWKGEIDLAIVGPSRGLSEVMLFHAPTRTLLLTDLAFHMVRYPRPVDRWIWRLSGIPAGFGPGRTSRTLLLRERAAVAGGLARALAWEIERIVVAHGDVVEEDAAAAFRRAFAPYLPGAGERP